MPGTTCDKMFITRRLRFGKTTNIKITSRGAAPVIQFKELWIMTRQCLELLTTETA